MKPVGVRLIAEGASQYTADLKNAGSATRGFSSETQASAKQTAAGATGMQKLAGAAKSTISAIKDVTFAAGVMGATFKQAWDLLGQGAQLELATTRFDKLAESIGTTADALLGELGEATKGMMSNAEMMASASQIISLGLADNQDEVVRLATLVSELGWDMSQVILTFANDSKMRLDALGLSVQDVEARMKALQAQGIATDKAFDLAVIEAGEAKLALLGSAAGTTAGDMQKLEANLKNMKDEFLQAWAAMASPTVAAASGSHAEAVDKMIAGNLTAAKSFQDLVAEGQRIREIERMWLGLAGAMTGTQGAMRDGLKDVIRELALASDSSEQFEEGLIGVFGSLDKAQWALKELSRELGVGQDEIRNYVRALREAEDADEIMLRYARAAAEATEGTRQGANALTGLAAEIAKTERVLDKYGVTSGMTTIQIEEMARASGELVGWEEQLQGGIDATNKATQAQADAMAAAAAAADAARKALGQYFAQAVASKDETTLFTTAISDLGTQYYTNVIGPTGQAAADLELLEKAYKKATTTLRQYELGIQGTGMEEEKRAEKMQALREQIASLEGQMAALNVTTTETGSVTNTLTINTEATNQALYDAAVAAGASAQQLAVLGVRLGILTEQEAEAALKQAALTAEIERLGEAVADGSLTINEAIDALRDFESQLTETGGTAGQVGADIAAGMTEGVYSGTSAFVNAITEMVQKGIDSAKQAAQAFSPSKVTMALGMDMAMGLAIGLADGTEAVEEAAEELSEALVQALEVGGAASTFTGGIFERRKEILKRQLGSIDEELNALATPLGLRGASIEQLTGELFKANARGDQNRVQLIRQLLALQSDRNALEAEYAAQQEEIIEAQRKMADIKFLQQQMELLKTIKEAGRADLLEGLELGLDASLPDLLAAMTEAMETLIDQADDELQAASPSKVFKKRGEWIMEGLREGIQSVKISGAEIVAPIMPPASPADITNRNITNTVFNINRTLNFSGHYASQPAIRDRDDLAFVLAGMG